MHISYVYLKRPFNYSFICCNRFVFYWINYYHKEIYEASEEINKLQKTNNEKEIEIEILNKYIENTDLLKDKVQKIFSNNSINQGQESLLALQKQFEKNLKIATISLAEDIKSSPILDD